MQLNPNMQYRPGAGGDMLSVLGYGCMRFTTNMGKIDMPKAEREIMTAIERHDCGSLTDG